LLVGVIWVGWLDWPPHLQQAVPSPQFGGTASGGVEQGR
jgi:hypothetical protein